MIYTTSKHLFTKSNNVRRRFQLEVFMSPDFTSWPSSCLNFIHQIPNVMFFTYFLQALKPGIASVKVSSFRLNWFNNAANNRVSFFVASVNSFFRQNQTSFVLSLIFSNKVLQWVFISREVCRWPIVM